MHRVGLTTGSHVAHYFTDNRVEDLAFRLAAPMLGTVPVTINWQGDTLDRIIYKIQLTACKLLLVDDGVKQQEIEAIQSKLNNELVVVNVGQLSSEGVLDEKHFTPPLSPTTSRVVIFTSGTTGQPKGVALSYSSYFTNRATFESFLECEGPGVALACVIINPMHHTNSTSFTDWALRRPRAKIHLVQRYSTNYWKLLTQVAEQEVQGTRIVCPAVSRHFDFLAELADSSKLPVDGTALMAAMQKIDFLIGSAPVGPTTIACLQKYAGRLPLVRFGSTETCLQVLGTPRNHSQEERLRIFQKGWAHTYHGEPQMGYYIGRAHPPHTEVKIVRGVDPLVKNTCMVEVDEGEPGLVATRGGNLMQGYVQQEEATKKAFMAGWYINLGDVAFWLQNEKDGGKDIFWQSRESALLIRGGSNYAYEQVEQELTKFVCQHYGVSEKDMAVAVVGMKFKSEHEDDCCVTIQLNHKNEEERQQVQERIQATFINDAPAHVSKGAKPNHVCFMEIPKNFKGAILVPDMKKYWQAQFDAAKPRK